jgi:hypothetical protein
MELSERNHIKRTGLEVASFSYMDRVGKMVLNREGTIPSINSWDVLTYAVALLSQCIFEIVAVSCRFLSRIIVSMTYNYCPT